MDNNVYIAMVRPWMNGGCSDPYGTILGVFRRHVDAENAIMRYYRSMRKTDKNILIRYIKGDDLSVDIYRGEEHVRYKGSILRTPLK